MIHQGNDSVNSSFTLEALTACYLEETLVSSRVLSKDLRTRGSLATKSRKKSNKNIIQTKGKQKRKLLQMEKRKNFKKR